MHAVAYRPRASGASKAKSRPSGEGMGWEGRGGGGYGSQRTACTATALPPPPLPASQRLILKVVTGRAAGGRPACPAPRPPRCWPRQCSLSLPHERSTDSTPNMGSNQPKISEVTAMSSGCDRYNHSGFSG